MNSVFVLMCLYVGGWRPLQWLAFMRNVVMVGVAYIGGHAGFALSSFSYFSTWLVYR